MAIQKEQHIAEKRILGQKKNKMMSYTNQILKFLVSTDIQEGHNLRNFKY